MKTLVVREFTRGFKRHRNETCQVEDQGRVLGTWTPIQERPPKVDFAARRRKLFKAKLPFTGTELLARSNPR